MAHGLFPQYYFMSFSDFLNFCMAHGLFPQYCFMSFNTLIFFYIIMSWVLHLLIVILMVDYLVQKFCIWSKINNFFLSEVLHVLRYADFLAESQFRRIGAPFKDRTVWKQKLRKWKNCFDQSANHLSFIKSSQILLKAYYRSWFDINKRENS